MSPFVKYYRALIGAVILCIAVSCTTFMLDEQEDDVMKLDRVAGVMKKALVRDDYRLEQGQRVKLHILLNEDNIRVYAYPADVDFLKSNRLLVLYLFEDDFKDGRFDKKVFMEKLGESVTLEK